MFQVLSYNYKCFLYFLFLYLDLIEKNYIYNLQKYIVYTRITFIITITKCACFCFILSFITIRFFIILVYLNMAFSNILRSILRIL